MFTQELLRHEAQQRIDRARRFPPAPGGFGAVAVVAKFDPAVFVESALRFAAGVPADAGARWCAAFTRTVFLAGQPVNLETRFPPDHQSADRTVAWYGPGDSGALTALRRLLRPLRGPGGVSTTLEVDIPLDGRGSAVLEVDVSTSSVEQYLVHVNHVLAEAVITGILGESSSLRLRHVRRIDPAGGPFDYLRVAPHRREPDRLCCYAALSRSQPAFEASRAGDQDR